jgi:LysM repeat protein
MLNPFVNLNSTAIELELKRRERLRIGVYSFLMATILLLMGLLIQGCRAEQKPAVPSPRQVHLAQLAESGNNPAQTIAAPELSGQPQNSEPPAAVPAANIPDTKAPAGASAPPAIPVLTAPAVELQVAEPSVYVVKRGDTLSAIAKAHRTTAKALKAANGLTGDRLQIGEKLKVPVPTLASLAR